MRGFRLILCGFLLVGSYALHGCGELFTPSPAPRRDVGASDYYMKKYAERELRKRYATDPGSRVEVKKIRREGSNWLVDIMVTSVDGVAGRRVLVDSKGRVLEER